jgi:hypothetical protein
MFDEGRINSVHKICMTDNPELLDKSGLSLISYDRLSGFAVYGGVVFP